MFVDDAKVSVKDRTLIKSTIDLAHNLGLRVTAEGVEDTETVGALQVMGCDFIQGYVFSKALPVEGLIDFLRQSVDTPVPETRHARPAN
jgi:EAL domain-containing protein (putative c-di-GMP-specific phosphodiesterase class I)